MDDDTAFKAGYLYRWLVMQFDTNSYLLSKELPFIQLTAFIKSSRYKNINELCHLLSIKLAHLPRRERESSGKC